MIIKVLGYMKRFLDPTDSGASLRQASFAAVIVMTILWMTAALVTGIVKGCDPITSEWNFALGILVSAVTGSKIMGQKLLNQASKDAPGDPEAPAPPAE